MSNRVALRSVLAFCLALGVGRLLFPSATPQSAPGKETAGTASAVQSAVAVSAPVQAPLPPSVRTPKAPPERPVTQDFQVVDGGVVNENVRLTHFISGQYTEGSLHKAAQQFGATVRWVPVAQELRRGDDMLARVKATPAQAAVEQAGKHNRVAFAGTYPDTDERMFVRKDGGLEHDIILKRLPQGTDETNGVAYTGMLQLSSGLTLWDGKQQITGPFTTKDGVHIKNQFGTTVFYLRAPYAFDASVTKADGSLDKEKQANYSKSATGCEYRIDFDDAGATLAVVTPGKWLSDPARAYPVTIDPNLGPFGLADGNPPIYVGTVGSDTVIPANAGGAKLVFTQTCVNKPDNARGAIPLPFAFEYYGNVYPIGFGLEVHLDGIVTFTPRNSCLDTPNQPIPGGGYPNSLFPYWSDLRISQYPDSGVYWFVDGVAPSRRLVIEWYKLGFANGVSNQYISFNCVLYECDNKIEFIIGQADETDRGVASVGIVDPSGLIGIQYDFNSALGGQLSTAGTVNPFAGGGVNPGNGGIVNPIMGGNGGVGGGGSTTGTNPTQAMQPISPGTALSFQRSAMGFLTVKTTTLSGCIPHTVCFNGQITVPASACGTNTTTTTFGFHWKFRDGSEGFTQNLCHTWVTPGRYPVTVDIMDEFGTTSQLSFNVNVCDVPDVVITADPQGGQAPLYVNLTARVASETAIITAGPNWVVDQLGTHIEPGQFLTMGNFTGTPLTLRFDTPGIYRVSVTFTGTDQGMATTGTGTVFIFVAAPSDIIEDSLVILESKLAIDWMGKHVPLQDPAGGISSVLQLPPDPEGDTLTIKGVMSLPNIQKSALLGKRIGVSLNGVEMILDAFFDANGKAVQAPQENKRTAEFSVKLPSGQFQLKVKRSLYAQFGVNDMTEQKMLPAFFRIQISDGIFPPPGSEGAMITYDYVSNMYNVGPPASGGALGAYRFGAFGKVQKINKRTPIDVNMDDPHQVMLTGTFMVLDGKLKLDGNMVSADLKGKLARYGGDDLRPQDDSNVVVSLGNWSEAVNFTTTAGFKAKGKPPSQIFTFKRSKAMGATGISQLQWKNRAGDFRVKTFPIPNELVGLNPALGVQTLILGLMITPDGAQVFDAKARFEVTKISPTQFTRNGK